MKKIILISYLTVVSNALYAQITLGVKAGISVADFRASHPRLDYTSNRLSYHLGGSIEYKIARKWGVSAEFLYSEKGNKTHSYAGPLIVLPYLSFPILCSFSPIKNIQLKVGPEISYLLKPYEIRGGSTYHVYGYKKKDLSLDMELCVKVKKKFGVGMRYNYGLVSVIEADLLDMTSNTYNVNDLHHVKFYNTVLQFFVSYDFLTPHDFSDVSRKLKL